MPYIITPLHSADIIMTS